MEDRKGSMDEYFGFWKSSLIQTSCLNTHVTNSYYVLKIPESDSFSNHGPNKGTVLSCGETKKKEQNRKWKKQTKGREQATEAERTDKNLPQLLE